MGREVAHQLIKKHSTALSSTSFLSNLANEKDFPISIENLKELIATPVSFAGLSTKQCLEVSHKIEKIIMEKNIEVELDKLR